MNLKLAGLKLAEKTGIALLLSFVFASPIQSWLGNGTIAQAAAQSKNDLISGTRIGGWIGHNALLVLPDRTAAAVGIGSAFGAARLIEIGDTSYTIEYDGQKGKNSLDPAWQLMAHPDLSNWLVSYMKATAAKIDAQYPNVSKECGLSIDRFGGSDSSVLKIQQALPFQKLPDWIESIDFKVSINPHEATRIQFLKMKITEAAYKRLITPLYGDKDGSAK